MATNGIPHAISVAGRLGWVATRVTALVSLGALVAAAGLSLAGFHLSVVSTGSMSPTLAIDALTISAPAQPTEISEGDIITFSDRDGDLVMHRVVEVLRQGSVLRFRTQGDANRSPDSQLVHEKKVHARLQASVSHLGAPARSLRTPGGIAVVLLLQAPLLAWAWRGRSPQPNPARMPAMAWPFRRYNQLCPSWLEV